MAIIKAKVCDVHRSQKNQNVEATDTTVVSVPGVAFGGAKARRFTIDVCSTCQREVRRLESKAKADTQKAWAAMLAMAGTDAQKLSKSKGSQDSKSKAEGDDDDSEDAAEDTQKDAQGSEDTQDAQDTAEQDHSDPTPENEQTAPETSAPEAEAPAVQWSDED